MINSLIDEINLLLSRPVGSVTKRVSVDIVHPRDQLKRLRSHLEKLTEDNHLNNLDQQYQGLIAHLQEKISINRQTSDDISAESKKLEIFPPTTVKLEPSNLFSDKSDFSMENRTVYQIEEHSPFLNDYMIASRQQLMNRLGEKQIKTVEKFADVIGGFSELWELLKNRQVSIYQVHCRDTILDSNHKTTQHAKGRVVQVDNEDYLNIKIKVDFHPDYRLIDSNTGNSQSVKVYTKTQFVFGFQEINPPLSLQEVKDKKDKLEADKKQREIRSHKNQELRIKTNVLLEDLENQELRIRTNILLEDLENIFEQDFDSSDFFYNLKCSQYISFESYNIRKLDFLNRKKKEDLLENLEELLRKHLFVEADEFYQLQCKNYINLRNYELKKKPFLMEKKNLLLLDLDKILMTSFIEANVFYYHELQSYISQHEYNAKKQNFVQSWIKSHLNNNADLEQSIAIGSVNSHVQLIARAGSGKTSTLVNRAIFLQKHCGIKPSEILLLAFNRKAAQEIRERLQNHLQNDLPYAMTFHALAYALVRPSQTLSYNESGGQQAQTHLIQSVINDHLKDSVYRERIKSLMIRRFKAEWFYLMRKEFNLTEEERLASRRTKPQMGIDGVTYKSIGEKFIADFLFEHDIPFIYERNFWWGYGEERTNYHPDFTILKKVGNKKGIVIEYFGLQGDPDYDRQSQKKRQYWQNHPDFFFVEINPSNWSYSSGRNALEQHLSQVLTEIGLRFRRLTETQLWAKVDKRAINRFDKAMTNFIGRCRKKCWTPNQLSAEINNRNFDPNSEIDNIEREFLHLAEDFYVAYLNLLQQRNEEDFDGIMQRSAQKVNEGKTVFVNRDFRGDLRDIKYIMIDEYQDFSLLFHNLISAIRKHNQQALFFCVGDDWQAINSFAGADLYFYENFKEIFQPSHTLSITTNYRSGSQIVDIGNKLMSNRGVLAKPSTQSEGEIQLVDIAKFQMTPIEEQEHNFDLNAILIRLISKLINDGKEITLLSRNNDLQNAGYRIRTTIDGVKYFDKRIEIEELRKSLLDKLKLTDEQRKRIDISTTHKYKGKEKQVIIVLDADRYGNIHPDSIFNRIFGDDEIKLFEDERRLLYVALTRAKNELFIVTNSFDSSPFIAGLTKTMQPKEVDWANYPVPMTEKRFILVKVSNQQGRGSSPTREINEFLRSESYRFDGNLMYWYKVELIQTFLANGSRLQYLIERNWSSQANGIEVNFCNEKGISKAAYLANNGKWTCNFDNFKQSKPDEYDYDDDPF